MFVLPLILSIVSTPKGVDYDVIFSVTVGLGKVYPNFFDKPHSLVNKNKEKLGYISCTRGPPQPVDYNVPHLYVLHLSHFASIQNGSSYKGRSRI